MTIGQKGAIPHRLLFGFMGVLNGTIYIGIRRSIMPNIMRGVVEHFGEGTFGVFRGHFTGVYRGIALYTTSGGNKTRGLFTLGNLTRVVCGLTSTIRGSIFNCQGVATRRGTIGVGQLARV